MPYYVITIAPAIFALTGSAWLGLMRPEYTVKKDAASFHLLLGKSRRTMDFGKGLEEDPLVLVHPSLEAASLEVVAALAVATLKEMALELGLAIMASLEGLGQKTSFMGLGQMVLSFL